MTQLPSTMSTQQPRIDPSLLSLDVNELVAVTVRLAEILDEETQLLANMDINGMSRLHPEKLKLTQMMESYQSILRARPDAVDDLPDATRDQLIRVISGFGQIMEHNFRQVATARAVNQKVVQAITDSIAEQQHLTVYTREGNQTYAGVQQSGISINLNQKA